MTTNTQESSKIEWENEAGNTVTVTAEDGMLYVSLDGENASIEHSYCRLDKQQGVDCLNAGKHSYDDGEKYIALIPLEVSKDRIRELRKNSREPTKAEQKEQEALDEAEETGEEVLIKKWTTSCDGSERGCSTDIIKRFALPNGETENRRMHTF